MQSVYDFLLKIVLNAKLIIGKIIEIVEIVATRSSQIKFIKQQRASYKLLMSDFKTKMDQIRFRLVLRPRPSWDSLQRSSDPIAG